MKKLIGIIAIAVIAVIGVAVAVGLGVSQADAHSGHNSFGNGHITFEISDTNRISVTPKTGVWVKVHRIIAYRDITSDRSDAEECDETNCWYDTQLSRRGAKHLDYRCRDEEGTIGVYVVYEKGNRIKILPDPGNPTYHQTWVRSHKMHPNDC